MVPEGTVSEISELGRRDFFKAGATGIAAPGAGASQAAPKPSVYNRIEAHLHSVTAIDVHDHLRPANAVDTENSVRIEMRVFAPLVRSIRSSKLSRV